MIESASEISQSRDCETLAKLSFDSIKQNDLKFIFEVLAAPFENRTIADLDSLAKIMMHIEPIKKLQNMSAVYFLCKRMILAKYKSKDIIYQGIERADSLYIVLNGKIAFYKKSTEYFDSDEVIFLNSGSCFGKLYQWKVKFMPISVQQTLLAIAPKAQVNKIPMHLSYERQIMIQELKSSDILSNIQVDHQLLQQVSKLLTLSKVPCGNFIVREGETPKAVFYILKGIVKKIICEHNKVTEVKRYFQSQYFPKRLKQVLDYDLIAETACQIIVIPKKALKMINSPLLNQGQCLPTSMDIQEELKKKKEWSNYKQSYLANIINLSGSVKCKPKNKQWKL